MRDFPLDPIALWRRQPVLAAAGFACLLAFVLTAVMASGDPRQFQGTGTWVKPMKFQASVGVLLLTVAWFYGNLDAAARRRWPSLVMACALVVAGGFEVFWITWQGAQQVRSHFNIDSRLASLMYQLMGVGALVLTLSQIWLAVRIARHGNLPPGTYRASVVISLVLTGILGTLTGAMISIYNTHWVGGAPTDAGGLPVFGWVRDGGDLRVAHFFGMHVWHILPLAGAALTAMGLRGRVGTGIVVVLAFAYAGLTVGTMLEAMAGQPFLPMLGRATP